jgi:hypothetical protein
MHVVILCCFKLCILFYIRSRALQRACVFDFMPNQNGCFLSYLMLVPVLSIQYTFLTAAFFNCRAYVGASVCGSWTRFQRGTCHVGSCSNYYTVLLFCLYILAMLVCNFACDLCCFIVNVHSVKSSVELMLYCFIMCRFKIKFSYLILSYREMFILDYLDYISTVLTDVVALIIKKVHWMHFVSNLNQLRSVKTM